MDLPLTPLRGLIAALLLGANAGRAQENQPSEYQVKAAFLYNFAQFVDWPATAFADDRAPLVIGIFGTDPFGGELDQTVKGKSLNSHPLAVKQLSSLSEATNHCHILFISPSEKKRLPEIFSSLGEASVLTVGETDRFIENGGMINFILVGAKIRFQINNAAAKHAGLKISSKLLNLASHSVR